MLGYFETILDEQRHRFFLWCPVLLGAGAGFYFTLSFEPFLPIGPAVSIILAGFILASQIKAQLLRQFLLALCLFATGLTLASFRANQLAAPVLAEAYFGTVEGRVIKIDRSQSNRLRITLDRLTLYGLEPIETPERVRITLPTKSAEASVGSRVLIYARLEGPGAPVEPGGFDFRRWAWFKQLGGVGYALGPQMMSGEAPKQSVLTIISELRHLLSNFIQRSIPGNDGAFAAAILTGDRSAIDPRQLEDLRASNLAHLLAISGLHMGLLTGFVFGLVRYGVALIPPLAVRMNAKKIGAASAIPVGALYLILSGASIATQRAYIMALVVLIAVLLDRPAFTLRAVALAALIVLLISPESVTQVGFQLSFAATIGLVVGFDGLRRLSFWKIPAKGRNKFLKGAFSVAFSSAVAGMATAPFAAFHFNQFAQYGLIANLLAVPIMGFVVMPCAITALILSLVGLGQPFFWIAGMGIAAILKIAGMVAGLDGSVVRVPSADWFVLPILASGCVIAVLWVGRLKYAGVSLALAALVLWIGTKRPDVLIDKSGSLVGVMTKQGRALSKSKGNGFSAKAWLEHDGDTADQKTAASREWVTEDVSLIKGQPDDLQRECALRMVVIAPETEANGSSDCLIVDQKLLRDAGAIAIYFNNGSVDWKPSETGKRLWSGQ